MGLFNFFSKKKKHKYDVGDVVKVKPNPNLPGHIRGDPELIKQANGIGKIGEIYDDMPNGHVYYVVNLVIIGNNWHGAYCLEEELEPYE